MYTEVLNHGNQLKNWCHIHLKCDQAGFSYGIFEGHRNRVHFNQPNTLHASEMQTDIITETPTPIVVPYEPYAMTLQQIHANKPKMDITGQSDARIAKLLDSHIYVP